MQEFDLDFVSEKSNRLVVFVELMLDLPNMEKYEINEDSFVDGHIFLIFTANPWYGDIIIYLHTLKVPPHLSLDECLRLKHNANNCLIIGGKLYCRGVDSILRQCLTHEEAEMVLKFFHGGTFGGHLSRLATTKKILIVVYY